MKTKKTTKDFFSRYKADKFKKIQMYGLSGILAVFGAFMVNSLSKGDVNMQSMMANVSQITQNQKEYPADLVLETQSGGFQLVFGAYAQSIDSVEGILVGDPAQLESLQSSTENLTLTPLSGMYRFHIDMKGKTVNKGTIIARFEGKNIDSNRISLTDTQFTSHGNRYNISNIVE